ncbi:MAG: glycosyltransferase [Mariprofundaceae bacterium]|nr:glycosyltransferase [Mariprofundaceae bacterium]
MRILYLTDGDLAPHKAPQIHVSQFLKHWHQSGCEVLLRAPRTEQDMPEFEFPHVWLPHVNIRLLGDWLFQWRMYRQLKKELQEKRWDVVYTRQISTFPALYRLCREFAVPILCEVNGFLLENYQTGGASAWKLRMVEAMEKKILQYSSLVVVPYTALKERMNGHYKLCKDKVMVVENGVDPTLFRSLSRQQCRTSLGLKSDAVYIGYVGSFDFYHDMETIFRAYKGIAEHITKPVYFLMVGDGERKTAMQALAVSLGIDSFIHFVGAVPNQQVPEYINACDVMLALQPRERLEKMGEAGFLKTREYLACEVPVVLSHIRGTTHPFAEDACVYIEPESIGALERAVVDIMHEKISLSSVRDEIVAHGSWAYSAECLRKKMQLLMEQSHA